MIMVCYSTINSHTMFVLGIYCGITIDYIIFHRYMHTYTYTCMHVKSIKTLSINIINTFFRIL